MKFTINSCCFVKKFRICIPEIYKAFNQTKNNMNPNKMYYVCSYGGCGSTILSTYLSNFGLVKHVHSRYPPSKLEYVGDGYTEWNVYKEWFNLFPVPEENVKDITVIYIYRNPVEAIFSRFSNPEHLQHIQCQQYFTIQKVLDEKKDLYEVEEFFTNYTRKNVERNYSIVCVKYEELFENWEKFNQTIGIPNVPDLYPIKKQRELRSNDERKLKDAKKILTDIYSNLIQKMERMDFITIV